MRILLLPPYGHAHLAEPGCLCTKQACKQSSWILAKNLHENRPFLTCKWCGHLKSHLDHYCFIRKGLEFAPQQMPGPQSQLGGLVGLVGSRWKTRWKIARVGLELRTSAPEPRTQSLYHTATIYYIHTYIIVNYMFDLKLLHTLLTHKLCIILVAYGCIVHFESFISLTLLTYELLYYVI